jgi:UDP-N-acetylmuramoyl-L-alanyl-D-glutamate--2,6-diaminopimelate ligase
MIDVRQTKAMAYSQPISLRQLSAGLGRLQAEANDAVFIKGISDDSRYIRPGYVLMCLPRSKRYANEYAIMAKAKGATAIISVGISINVDLPILLLDSMQQAGLLLRRLFETEDTGTHLFGITGTDGKTSIAWMLREALSRYQHKPVWSCGTLGWMRRPDDVRDIGNTTPSMLTMHALLSSACLEDVHSVICEISSHGIAQERIAGLDFKTAIWTSMGHDHLQDHGGYAGYLATKAKFICTTAEQGGQVIANADHGDIRSNAPAGSRWYGRGLYREDVDLSWEQELPGLLRLHSGDQEVVIENIPLGDFHAENTACVALALMTSVGITLGTLPALLNDISAPPGRMQYLTSGVGQVFIDYAHTPEALERCMQAARKLTHHRLLLTFGCGGERDREKRPQMGAIAAKYADIIWITSDNPRGELPAVIASEIEEGMSQPYQAEIHLQLDRELAIAEAIAELSEGDTLIIAGKGHEAYMETAGIRTPWSDADIASKYLHKNSFFSAESSGDMAACA